MMSSAGPRRGNEDDQPSTEPLSSSMMAALRDAGSGAHTLPLARSSLGGRGPAPRTKKARVSFHTVTSATFSKDSEDPFKLSSPQERELSPLVDTSFISDQGQAGGDEEEDTAQLQTVAELCATPESGVRRDPVTGGLSSAALPASPRNPQIDAVPAAEPDSLSTPVRRLTGSSSMAESLPGSETPGGTPGGTPGEMTNEVTGEVAHLERLVQEDEQESDGKGGRLPRLSAPSPDEPGWNLFQEYKNSAQQESGSEQPELPSTQVFEAGAPEAQSSSIGSGDTANLAQTLDRATRNVNVSPLGSAEIPEARASFSGQLPVYNAGSAQPPAATRDAAGYAQVSSAPARPSMSSPDTRGTYDFEAVNRDFDRSNDSVVPSRSPAKPSPPAAPVPQPSVSSSSLFRPAQWVAKVGSFLPGRRDHASSRSPPPSSGGRKIGSRSPQQDFAKWAAGSTEAPLEHSPQGSESGLLPARSFMHPISQLTGGPSSSFVTRKRIGWEEFIQQCNLHGFDLDERQSTRPMDTSSFAAVPAPYRCQRTKAMHETLQQRRAQCLDEFVADMGQEASQRKQQYNVEIQMWERSTETFPVATKLLQVMGDPMEQDAFTENVKEWHAFCKDQARHRWYQASRKWLEKDVEIMKQHTHLLQEEVDQLADAKRKCKDISNEVRGGCKRVNDMGELHDIRQSYQELQREDLRRTQEERHLAQRKLPEQQSALEAERRRNEELEQKIQDLKERNQHEQFRSREARGVALQQKLFKTTLEKQRYAHTCLIHKATPTSICLHFRGNIKLWIEKAPSGGTGTVRVCIELPEPAANTDSLMKISPEVSRGLLACVWHRILAVVNGSKGEKLMDSALAKQERQLTSTLPCKEVPRFLRHLDAEILCISDFMRSLHNLRKDVPEVAQLSAELVDNSQGHLPTLSLTAMLTVLRSHRVLTDGILKPLTREAKAGEFDAVQCVAKFNADLAALPDLTWSQPVVSPILGRLDIGQVEHAAQSAAAQGSLHGMLAAAVQAMRQGIPTA